MSVFKRASLLFSLVAIDSLVFFRITFGALMVWKLITDITSGEFHDYFVAPRLFFPYPLFSWLPSLPHEYIFVIYCMLIVLAACIAVGFFYRIVTALFFILYTYVFLIDQTFYRNFEYLILLVSFILCWVSPHKNLSVDSLFQKTIRSSTIPFWQLFLLRSQFFIVYFYSLVSKFTFDWLSGQPAKYELSQLQRTLITDGFLTQEQLAYGISYGGIIIEALVLLLLCFKKTRIYAVLLAVAMHTGIFYLFGVEKELLILMTLGLVLFLPPSWWSFLSKHLFRAKEEKQIRFNPRIAVGVALFILVQSIIPLRQFFYSINPDWTEEGKHFSWRMKSSQKLSQVSYIAKDAEGIKYDIPLLDYLTWPQYNSLAKNPVMITQFANYLKKEYDKKGKEIVSVFADVSVIFNGRVAQAYIDSQKDLLAVSDPYSLVLPLGTKEQPDFRITINPKRTKKGDR